MNERQKFAISRSTAGRLLVVAAALLWSTSGFFAKAPFFAGWPGPVLAFWRAIFACCVLFPAARERRWSWKLFPMMGVFAAMNYTYLTSLVKCEASVAIWLQSTAPMWVFLVSVLLLGEPAKLGDWFLLGVGSTGVGLILWHELQGASPEGVLYGLASGVCYAGIVLSLRWLREFNSAWLVALNHLATALALAPTLSGSIHQGHWPQGVQWLFLAGFGILQMGTPYVLFARGLKSIPAHEASGIGLLEPVLLPVWVFVAWRHDPGYTPPRWWTLAGGGLILAALVIRYVAQLRQARRLSRESIDASSTIGET